MKKITLFFLTNFLWMAAFSQAYWQQKVDYSIDVSLNEKEKTLDAFEKLIYNNNSPDTLHFIWFHLWPNAYKNDKTAFSDQLLENGNTAFYFSEREQRGYINRLDFKVDNTTAKTEDHPQHIDIIKVLLPKPLPPGGQTTITTPFHVKLPFNFSRGGYDGSSFQVTQWYPKPAVYDRKGWHPMPYLDQGEFYSEFGSFDIRITVPQNYVVAATGELQTEAEKEWLKGRADFNQPETIKSRTVPTRKGAKTKTPLQKPPVAIVSQSTKTLHFTQNNVHDFAWFADKNFIVNTDTLQLPSGRTVSVAAFYTPAQKQTWRTATAYAKEALRFYSSEVGEYPYKVATVVQGPQSFGGGMEYPTITIISPTPSPQSLDGVIAHELGHNWFYGILASNEREHPWMDEGINSYYEREYMEKKYGKETAGKEILFQIKAKNKTDQPIETPSAAFRDINYGLIAYHKTAEWMRGMAQKVGMDSLRRLMQQYYEKWKFKHPYPEDFTALLTANFPGEAGEFVSQLNSTGSLPHNKPEGTRVISPLKKGSLQSYLQSPAKNALVISPAIGINSYDKLMLGGLLTNYGSPGTNFNFLAIPLYATGSKSLVGIGKMNYAFRSNGMIRKTDLFLNVASFNMDEFKDSAGKQYLMKFVKFVPGIRFTFKEANPRSAVTRYIQWKTFLINEQSLRVTSDSIFNPSDTVIRFNYTTPKADRYLNSLQFVLNNARALYPFDAVLQVEQARDFIRTTFTGNYFFNYAKGGGLAVRFFAGKFNYLNGKTIRKQFANDRYHLNLTGPKGYEDYTYSDYFFGRNRFDGLPNQQIMIRDGAFKVRTDLLASKIGKTDNWLTAVNFVSTIPRKINPLSVLPFNIPLRVYADIGTYAEAWEREADPDRFLYNAGLQLSVLQESVNIYIPLLYSSVYRTYFKSTIPDNRFLKTISFSINLYNRQLKKINREFEF